jgi:hypothetical protein
MAGINRNPIGLLDFLQTQSGGRNPDFLQESVRPTIDVEPFYTPDRLRAAVESFSMTTGQIEFIAVPEGEVWKILTFGFVTTTTVSSGADIAVQYGIERIPGQGFNGRGFASFYLKDSPAQNVVDYQQLPVPLIVTSGQRITITCVAESSTGAFAGDFEVIYTLLQANPNA